MKNSSVISSCGSRPSEPGAGARLDGVTNSEVSYEQKRELAAQTFTKGVAELSCCA